MPGGCPSWYVKALNWSTHENECWEKAYKLVCPKIILRSSQYIFLVTLRERVLNELCDGLLPYQTNFIFPKKARAKVCCLNFSLETQKESSQRMGEVDIIWRRMSCICRLKNVVLCWNSPNSKKLINWNWAWVWRRGYFIQDTCWNNDDSLANILHTQKYFDATLVCRFNECNRRSYNS